ncbi:MAG: glycoside hydrolase family 3 protein [Pseudomonadales bacterium]|jgi:beta-glucosidase|nr:glycoside hydrolase family 3 protein [Pseudomonadales bacterium]
MASTGNIDARIEGLVAELSLDEKAAMAAGSGLWFSTPVERLGIPAFKMSDGPNGVRGEARGGVTSTCFPVGVALGASWDVELIGEIGAALAEEARVKGVDVLLGPTVNLQRTPLAGRNFECYSEDPHLTAELAIAYTRGVQGRDVAVCLKHFVCNDSEFERQSISSVVDARTLREVYLRPFERAIREAGAWSLMSAYNRLNGEYCSANHWLLTELLREQWGFDGVVISDWGGTYDTVGPARAGLDLEMPGPPRRMGEALAAAVRAGEVDETALDDKVRRQLRLMVRTGRLDAPEHGPEADGDDPARRELAHRAAIAGMVLLKNERETLPLRGVRRLALIGPNAVEPQIQGGGSSGVSPHFVDLPEQALREALPETEIRVARGCASHRYLPLLPPELCRVEEGGDRAGLKVSFHAGHAFAGDAVKVTRPRRSALVFFGDFDPAVPREFSAVVRTWLTPRRSGEHVFSLLTAGRARLTVDGRPIVDDWEAWTPGESYFGNGGREQRGSIELEAGVPVLLEVHYSREAAPQFAALRIGLLEPEPLDLMADALEAARDAEVAVVMVGLDGEWETEGVDRVDLALPGAQSELVRRVLAVNPNTIVVINAGSPIDTSGFRFDARAILQLWYPGQACGRALADVLTGRAEPGGRLPVTLPERLEDHPSWLDYPGEFGEVRYGDGVFVGHRGFLARGTKPAFPFGHGLGYARFELDRATAEIAGDRVRVSARLRNEAERAGGTTVQVYFGAPGQIARRPPLELCGFRRVQLEPGRETRVEFDLPLARFACFDPRRGVFRTEAGTTRVELGFSSVDLRGHVEVELPAQEFDAPA